MTFASAGGVHFAFGALKVPSARSESAYRAHARLCDRDMKSRMRACLRARGITTEGRLGLPPKSPEPRSPYLHLIAERPESCKSVNLSHGPDRPLEFVAS